MGKEARCTARFEGKVSEGDALLETDAILFRGTFRLAIPLKSVTSVDVAEGALAVTFSNQGDGPAAGGSASAVLELGPLATKWAETIRSPKGRMDKLGVKPGLRVSVVGAVDDASFLTELGATTEDVSTKNARKDSDLIFFAAKSRADLDKLGALKASLKKNGAIWVLRRKGKEQTVGELEVQAAGKAAGLVDTKVVRFSETLTAEKLVIPRSAR